jgi:hypothetical protein
MYVIFSLLFAFCLLQITTRLCVDSEFYCLFGWICGILNCQGFVIMSLIAYRFSVVSQENLV